MANLTPKLQISSIGSGIESVPAMDIRDWRSPDSRGQIINKIMETLKKHLPNSGPEHINELRRIAATFEEKTFNGAINQTDYLRKISWKLLTMETKSQNAAASSSSSPSILAANNSLLLIPGHHMDSSKPCLPKAEPAENTDDWRSLLPSDSRNKNANKIMETLKKHVPNCEQQGTTKLETIAASFEELIFNSAIDQVDYFRKISFKMETKEE